MPPVNLITREMWEKMTPWSQGYALYWQASLPGSELKDITNPYPLDSLERREFAAGEFEAMMNAQDGED